MYTDWLPNALAIGVPYELFFHLSVKKLGAFGKAHAIRIEQEDQMLHLAGRYTLDAVRVAVSPFFKGSKSEYPKTNYLSGAVPDSAGSEEDEKRKYRERYSMEMAARRANWQIHHAKKTGGEADA